MTHHEREFFIALIRCGKVFVTYENIEIEIRPLTIEQNLRSLQIYNLSYEKAFSEEFMTEEDVNTWMFENKLWTEDDDKKTEGLQKDIEKLKEEIYNSRKDEKLVKRIRIYLRAGESQLASHLNRKYVYYSNTCEGIASSERLSWIIKNTCYKDNKLYDFKDVELEYITSEYQSSFLTENKLRELARNDPWKTLWITRKNSKVRLFSNPRHTELTYNQKNILVWSQMYDNIQESLDCPEKEVIEDDDMLDGWIILQNKKREKEQLQRDFEKETRNDKINNSDEVFVMANNQKRVDQINSMNDLKGNIIKKQRFDAISKSSAPIEDHLLPDHRQDLNNKASSYFKRK